VPPGDPDVLPGGATDPPGAPGEPWGTPLGPVPGDLLAEGGLADDVARDEAAGLLVDMLPVAAEPAMIGSPDPEADDTRAVLPGAFMAMCSSEEQPSSSVAVSTSIAAETVVSKVARRTCYAPL
jgi:hypothetical protein